MTRIEFTATSDRDVIAGVTALLTAIFEGIDYEQPDLTLIPDHDAPDPTYAPRVTPSGYVPCPRRGQQEKLTDCWMCWNDVVHGVIEEPPFSDRSTPGRC